MLITKEVEINLNNKNYEHYLKLGYPVETFINRHNNLAVRRNKIKVKIEDVQKSSGVKVEICCDACQQRKIVTYNRYSHHNHDGKTFCVHCYAKIFRSGENSLKWNPYKTKEERENSRNNPEYLKFVQRVLARDRQICYRCGKKHKDVDVHHLNGYNWCIDGRLDDLNAVILCANCHSNFHLIYGKGNNTKEQFEEWIDHTVNDLQKYDSILPSARKIYCIEQDKIYHSAIQIEHILHIKKSNIYAICNKKPSCKSAKGLHFLWLDEYEKMTSKDVREYLQECKSIHNRKIICITTNRVFDKITDASKEYNTSPKNIGHALRKNQKCAGKLDDGTPLEWMYYEDYLEYKKHTKEVCVA